MAAEEIYYLLVLFSRQFSGKQFTNLDEAKGIVGLQLEFS